MRVPDEADLCLLQLELGLRLFGREQVLPLRPAQAAVDEREVALLDGHRQLLEIRSRVV